MQRLRLADPDNDASHSPLGDSLIQIAKWHAAAAQQQQLSDSATSIDWQTRFDQNRELITRRLQMIETELNMMQDSAPPLSVFAGDHHE